MSVVVGFGRWRRLRVLCGWLLWDGEWLLVWTRFGWVEVEFQPALKLAWPWVPWQSRLWH